MSRVLVDSPDSDSQICKLPIMSPLASTQVVKVDNFDNNNVTATRELSDLYVCLIPLRMTILGGQQKSKMVVFASLEHAFVVRRMLQKPVVGQKREVFPLGSSILIGFTTTTQDCLFFFEQFEAHGVFADWDKFEEYYSSNLPVTVERGLHNIGLIVRYICFYNDTARRMREVVRENAVLKYLHNEDPVARSIICCLWGCTWNSSSYGMMAKLKFACNPTLLDVLTMTEDKVLETNFAKCPMVTPTRKSKAIKHMLTLENIRTPLWRRHWQSILLALIGAVHPRLGQNTHLIQIPFEIILEILRHTHRLLP